MAALPISAVFGMESIPIESIGDALERDRKALESLRKA